jgi:hypothetical protein
MATVPSRPAPLDGSGGGWLTPTSLLHKGLMLGRGPSFRNVAGTLACQAVAVL